MAPGQWHSCGDLNPGTQTPEARSSSFTRQTREREGTGKVSWMVGGGVQRALCKHLQAESGSCSLTCGRKAWISFCVTVSPPPLSGRRQRDSEESFWAHSPRSPSISQDEGSWERKMGLHCHLLSKPQRPVPWPIFLTVSSQDALSPPGRETGWVGWRGRGDVPGSIFGNT